MKSPIPCLFVDEPKVGDLVVTGEIHQVKSGPNENGYYRVHIISRSCGCGRKDCDHTRVMRPGWGQQRFVCVREEPKPCFTRGGEPVRILCTDRKGAFPIVGIISRRNGIESVNVWTKFGRFCSDPHPHQDDLEGYAPGHKPSICPDCTKHQDSMRNFRCPVCGKPAKKCRCPQV